MKRSLANLGGGGDSTFGNGAEVSLHSEVQIELVDREQ